MLFGERLRAARLRAGLTQLQAAQSLGLSASAYCGYETGKRQPDLARLRRLSLLLHVSVDELLGLHAAPASRLPELSSSEAEGLSLYRSLDAHGQRLVRLVLNEELSRMGAISTPAQAKVSFRISEQPAAAGFGVYLGPDAFRSGDSMEPAYHDGDILIVSEALPAPGDVGVFVMDGMGYVKVCGHGELLSLNPAYAPIPMTEGIRPCGKVIGTLDPRLSSAR